MPDIQPTRLPAEAGWAQKQSDASGIFNTFLTEGLAISSPGAHFKIKHMNVHFLNPEEDF